MATQTCHSCHHENDPGARFCGQCGTPMGFNNACEHCGHLLKPGAAFCGQCGQRTSPPASTAETGGFFNGVWDKGEDELVRKVSDRDMIGRFFDADPDKEQRGFWGMLRSLSAAGVDALQGRTIVIPTGCIGLLMNNGEVHNVLPPGRQTTVRGLWDVLFHREHKENIAQDLIEQMERSGPSLYLIDRRPVPVQLQLEVPGARQNQSTTLGVSVVAHAVTGSDEHARRGLAHFLNAVVGDRDVLTARQLRSQIRPHLEQTAQNICRSLKPTDTDYEHIAQKIQDTLEAAFGRSGHTRSALAFDVSVSPRASVISLDLHLGQAQVPDHKPCIHTSCDGQIRLGAMFCPVCGKRQPSRPTTDRTCNKVNAAGQRCLAQVRVGGQFCGECGQPFEEPSAEDRKLISQDGELIELDLVLRAQGNRELNDPTPIEQTISDAAARLVRSMKLDELQSAHGFQRIGAELEQVTQRALRTLQLTLLDVTVLDCKSKNEEWVMGARAELNRARREQEVAQDWLDVDATQITLDGRRVTLDLQKLDVERMRMDVELRQMRMQRDFNFAIREVERADALRELSAQSTHQRGMDEVRLSDREARQDHLERGARMDVADATRQSDVDIQLDEANRNREITLRDRDHDNALTQAAQAHKRSLQRLDHSETLEDRAVTRRRDSESAELDHQISLEDRTAAHDDDQARRALKLNSDRLRQDVEDQDYTQRSAIERDLYVQRSQAQINLDNRARSQDIDLTGERARMEAQQDNKDRDHARLRDLKQMEMDEDARDRAHQLEILKQKAAAEAARLKIQGDQDIARLRAEAQGKAALRQSMANMTAQQIMAASMQERSLSDAEAAALGAGVSNQGELDRLQKSKEEQQALYERLLEREDLNNARNDQQQERSRQDMLQLVQQAMQQNMANVAAIAGNQQAHQRQLEETAKAARAREVAAHREAQAQARSMSERSMDTMAQVAASRATPGAPQPAVGHGQTPANVSAAPQKSAVASHDAQHTPVFCTNPECGRQLADPHERFCQHCGHRNPTLPPP